MHCSQKNNITYLASIHCYEIAVFFVVLLLIFTVQIYKTMTSKYLKKWRRNATTAVNLAVYSSSSSDGEELPTIQGSVMRSCSDDNMSDGCTN